MSEPETTVTTTVTSPEHAAAEDQKKPTASAISLSIWPPTQRTRDAVISRLIETLSMPSVLSKRYGTVPEEEASAAARRIEEEAFAVAGAAVSAEDDGLEVLQMYSKEISKRMLETVKSRTSTAQDEAPRAADGAGPVNEEVPSSVED